MDFFKINEAIPQPDYSAMTMAKERLDALAKPKGSLGLLENAVIKLASLQGIPSIDKRVLVAFCADNALVEEGIASTDPRITLLQAENIAQGKSAAGLMARAVGADIIAVDMGMFNKSSKDLLLDRRIAAGTANIGKGPAMRREDALKAIRTGMEIAELCAKEGYQIILTGEMGVGNTTASSAMAALLLKRTVDEVTGPGAGLEPEGLVRKKKFIQGAISLNQADENDSLDILAKLGGFDIAGLCGLYIGAALKGIAIVIDGFISSVAALVAQRLCPATSRTMFASHCSDEKAAGLVLEALSLKPLICAGMRLGEGTGALALLPLLDLALEVYNHLMPCSAFDPYLL